MLPEMPAEMREAQAMGVSLFAGEAEERRLDEVLRDAWRGEMKPLYNYMDQLPVARGRARADPAAQACRAHRGHLFQHRSRPRLSLSVLVLHHHQRAGPQEPLPHARRPRTDHSREQGAGHRPVLHHRRQFRPQQRLGDPARPGDRAAGARASTVGFTIQVDTLCHKIPNFIEKATKAGARRVFIGLENINPDNLIAAKKRQNKITEYRAMLQKWRAHGAITFAGYILGFPADTKELILRDIEIIKRELPLDILEFFFLTPLPGSEDHKNLLKKGVWMDPDINKYDLDHRVSHHSQNVGRRVGGGLPRGLGRCITRPSTSARS